MNMKILILAAMDKELSLLLNLLDHPEKNIFDGMDIYEGKVGENEIYISKCGIGKVNSALNAFHLINAIKPDLLINSGVAGGAGTPIGSVILADKVAYHDVWCGPGTHEGQADGIPLYMLPSVMVLNSLKNQEFESHVINGLICSGDRFISSPEEIQKIRELFPDVKAVDMESAAIAHACHISQIPFVIIRVVSDTPGEGENISQYQDFWQKAPEKSFEIIGKILSTIS